ALQHRRLCDTGLSRIESISTRRLIPHSKPHDAQQYWRSRHRVTQGRFQLKLFVGRESNPAHG
ncbi:hypothetical protein HAX54_021500, partial [Datura stramonium]|nr:hypothetical protein [Datura stramonium]